MSLTGGAETVESKKFKFKEKDILYIMQTYSNDRYTYEMREWDIIDRLRSMYSWIKIPPRDVRWVLTDMCCKGILKQRGEKSTCFTYFITSSRYLL